jgi:hypothetical protein
MGRFSLTIKRRGSNRCVLFHFAALPARVSFELPLGRVEGIAQDDIQLIELFGFISNVIFDGVRMCDIAQGDLQRKFHVGFLS